MSTVSSSKNTADDILAEVFKSLEDDDEKSAKLSSIIPPCSSPTSASSSKRDKKKKKRSSSKTGRRNASDNNEEYSPANKKSHKKKKNSKKSRKSSKEKKEKRSKKSKSTRSDNRKKSKTRLKDDVPIVENAVPSSETSAHPCDPVIDKKSDSNKQTHLEKPAISKQNVDIELSNRATVKESHPKKEAGGKRLVIGLSEQTKAILSKEPDRSAIEKLLEASKPDEEGEIMHSDYSSDGMNDKENEADYDDSSSSNDVERSIGRNSDQEDDHEWVEQTTNRRPTLSPLPRRSHSPAVASSLSRQYRRRHSSGDGDDAVADIRSRPYRRRSDDRSRSPHRDDRHYDETRRRGDQMPSTTASLSSSKRYVSRQHWRLGEGKALEPRTIARSENGPTMRVRGAVHGQRFRTDRSRSRDRQRKQSRSPSLSRKDRRSGKAYARREKWRLSQSPDDVYKDIINKKELLEIAKRNASAMLQKGTLQQICNMTSDEIAKLKSGGTSVDELVDYCKKLQKRQEKAEQRRKDASRRSRSRSCSSSSSGGLSKEKVHHPFALNPNRNNITFNVKNVSQIPVKTPAERTLDEGKLRITYPVSSGQQHRTKESEWVPVSPGRNAAPVELEKRKAIEAPLIAPLPSSKVERAAPKPAIQQAATPLPPPPAPPPVPPTPPIVKAAMAASAFAVSTSGTGTPTIGPSLPSTSGAETVFPSVGDENVDIGDVVAKRLKAIRRLYDNPNDVEALKMMHYAEEMMRKWAESKNVPGAFFGSTGVQCLTPDQLAPQDQKFQAWAKRDQFAIAKPLESGVGMSLLQKMGWKPGEGLGKNKEGTLKPLLLDIKSDRKGLVANEELIKKPSSLLKAGFGGASQSYSVHGKHPVSTLMELCAKRRWHPPSFTCVEQGPSHCRRFLWKVLVNGVEYQPASPSPNKKEGKLHAAQVAVQSLGLAPRDPNLPVIIA